MYFPSETSFDCFAANFKAKLVMVQNINRMVNALARADIKFTIFAICETSEVNMAKNAPNI